MTIHEPALLGFESGIATVTLNRPDLRNAFDEALIARLIHLFETLAERTDVRAIVLRGAGKAFCAGADLDWMKRMAEYSEAENLADARRLGDLMRVINAVPKPTIAAVQGAAYGGGVGLVACCDIAIATPAASFCLSEVKLGLVPGVISPYVVAAIGQRAARRYFLTAEVIDAATALRLGLVHEVADDLDAAVGRVVSAIRAGGPQSQAAAKELVFAVADRPADAAVIEDTAARIARQRASEEGREGVRSFLEKRKPKWSAT